MRIQPVTKAKKAKGAPKEDTTQHRVTELPEGMVRLAKFIKDWMQERKLTISTVSHNSNPGDPNNRIHSSTVFRIRDGVNFNVEDRTLELLERGLGVTPGTLRKVYLGTVQAHGSVRALELDNDLWQRLEISALSNRRVIRGPEGQLPDLNSELASILDEVLPPLRGDLRKAG